MISINNENILSNKAGFLNFKVNEVFLFLLLLVFFVFKGVFPFDEEFIVCLCLFTAFFILITVFKSSILENLDNVCSYIKNNFDKLFNVYFFLLTSMNLFLYNIFFFDFKFFFFFNFFNSDVKILCIKTFDYFLLYINLLFKEIFFNYLTKELNVQKNIEKFYSETINLKLINIINNNLSKKIKIKN